MRSGEKRRTTGERGERMRGEVEGKAKINDFTFMYF